LLEGRSAYALRDSGCDMEVTSCGTGGWAGKSESEGEKWQKLSTLDSRLSTLHFGKIIDSKIIF
jgi:hypothetical protein